MWEPIHYLYLVNGLSITGARIRRTSCLNCQRLAFFRISIWGNNGTFANRAVFLFLNRAFWRFCNIRLVMPAGRSLMPKEATETTLWRKIRKSKFQRQMTRVQQGGRVCWEIYFNEHSSIMPETSLVARSNCNGVPIPQAISMRVLGSQYSWLSPYIRIHTWAWVCREGW